MVDQQLACLYICVSFENCFCIQKPFSITILTERSSSSQNKLNVRANKDHNKTIYPSNYLRVHLIKE